MCVRVVVLTARPGRIKKIRRNRLAPPPRSVRAEVDRAFAHQENAATDA
jgi:hypothetical protein